MKSVANAGDTEMHETQVRSLAQKDPLEEGMTIHSSIFAWRIPWTEEPGGLLSTGSKDSDTSEVTTWLSTDKRQNIYFYS